MRNTLARLALALFPLLGSATVSFAAATVPSTTRPNIIFILADDLGYGDLGCYGQAKIKTPNLDRMAAEGMRFTQFYSGATVCAPSRCALMTGLHTGHCYIRGNKEIQPEGQEPIPANSFTVAKLLHQAGYATGLIGKWGLGGPGSTGVPTRQGFDYFFGYLCQRKAHNYYPAYLWRNETQVPLKNEVPMKDDTDQGWATKKVEYSHDLLAADALKWVESQRGKPFFLYLAVTIPHANNELTRDTGAGQEVPNLGPYQDTDWPAPSKAYAAMVTRLDADVGRLMALLKKLGRDEQTLVIFTSDNGPQREGGNAPEFFASAGPLRGIKRDLYEGGIRVPFIARWPGKIKAGSVSSQLGYFVDFMATAADLAGAAPPKNLDSLSLLPTLLGQPEKQKQHEYLYWEFHENGLAQAARMGDWKAVRLDRKMPVELYDLKSDLAEQHNVAAQHPDVAARLAEILRTARVDSPVFPVKEAAAGGVTEKARKK